MTEYFKTIDQQIDILEQRGLEIQDREKAKDALLRYNYYKVINATLPFFAEFEKNGKYSYRKGTNFQDLIEVHNFDKELKKLLLAQMLEIERVARSIISYKFVEKYPKKAAYLDVNNYDHRDKGFALTNIDSINEVISKYKEEENFNRSVNYYLKKYDSVPFWFIINFISFGKVVNIYETLDTKLKEDIADEFQKFVEENLEFKLDEFIRPAMLQSFLTNAKDIRNIAAHDNLILGYTFEDIEYFKTIHQKYGIKENYKRQRLFDTLVVLQALIPRSTYLDIEKDIKKLVEKLRGQVDEIAFEKILDSIGYTERT